MAVPDMFTDAVDGGVLLSVLEYLRPHRVLKFLETSASIVQRVDGQHRSIIRCLAIAHLGRTEVDAIALAADAARHAEESGVLSGGETSEGIAGKASIRAASGYVSALRLVASRTLMAVAFRQALKIATTPPDHDDLGLDAAPFLDALFQAEVRHRLVDKSFDNRSLQEKRSKRPRNSLDDITASAAISVVAGSGDTGSRRLLNSSARAISKAEQDLEDLCEGSRTHPFLYESVARKRSAVEFLRHRLPAVDLNSETDIAHLDAATQRLDRTVRGCVEEGFEFEIKFPPAGVPYAHWWLWLDASGRWHRASRTGASGNESMSLTMAS